MLVSISQYYLRTYMDKTKQEKVRICIIVHICMTVSSSAAPLSPQKKDYAYAVHTLILNI